MTKLLLIFAVLGAGDLPFQENIAQNGSFEIDQDRNQLPDGWNARAFDSPGVLQWDATTAHTGKRSLLIRDTANSAGQTDWKQCTGRWYSMSRPIVPGTEYKLEVWIKTRDVTGQAYAHLAWQKGSRWLSEIGSERLSGTQYWQKVTVTGVAPDDADTVVISMNLTRAKGTAWFDDVSVSGRSDVPEEVKYVFNDTSDWFPFAFPPNDTNLDSINLTHLLHTPAGKYGFLTVGDDGHFYFENGQRARFFGTNIGGTSCAPDKQAAPVIAARLAKYGVNMLRLHAMDSAWGPLIQPDQQTSQTLDSENLDRMDFFIAELKQRGIYIYMDLLDYRQFRTADGVAHADEFSHNWDGSMKGASIFDERMIELQKDYATKLLTHRNPYTKLRYVDDPAVAVIETTNENSVFYFYRNKGLSLPYYRDELQRRFNRWLIDRYGNREALARAWTDAQGHEALTQNEDPAANSVSFPFGMQSRLTSRSDAAAFNPQTAERRLTDALKFMTEIQDRYYQTMHAHLKQIGVKAPISGTNQSFAVTDTYIDAKTNDFMSRNQYWRHPHRSAKPFFKFSNEAFLEVDVPTERNPLSVIARTSVAGKPQAVAEFNFPWPNEFRAEGLLLASAYACLQDWDIFLLFSYSPGDAELSMFRCQTDPARWGEFPAAALMFHRHDVATAENEVHVVHTPEARCTPAPDTSHADYTVYRFLTFISKVRTAFIDDAYRGNANVALACGPSAEAAVKSPTKVIRFDEAPWKTWLYPSFVKEARKLGLTGYAEMPLDEKRLVSDTRELSLDYGKGLLTIDTARTQGVVGRLAKAGKIKLQTVQLSATTDFAAIVITSMDEQPIGASRRLLVTAVGRAEQTSQGYWPPTEEQARRTSMAWMLPGEGRLPIVVEPVQATIELPLPAKGTVYALDSSGKRDRQIPATYRAGMLQLDPTQARTIWCEVVVD